MKSSVHILALCLVFAAGLMLLSCSGAAVKKAETDAARDRYMSGMQKLEADDLKAAEGDFKKSVELDGKSPFGLTGLAFLEMRRTNYKQALEHVKQALKRDESFPDAHAVKGYILSVRQRGGHWMQDALQSFDRALALDPDNEKALFFLAECHLKAQHYEEAQKFYSMVAARDGMFAVRAKARDSLLSRILDVYPLTESCSNIALDDRIDKTDLVMLLIDEFNLVDRLKRHRSDIFGKLYNDDLTIAVRNFKSPPDIGGHRGGHEITWVVPLHLAGVDVMPNGYFFPDMILTRAQLAVTVQDILVLFLNDPDIATKHMGTISRFPDVRTDFYAFNAVMLCVDEGIMIVNDDTGDFRPSESVSGIEAIEMLRKLKTVLDAYSSAGNEDE